jgi:cytochrome P450
VTQLEFDHILSSIDALSPEQMRRLHRELDAKLATAANTAAPPLGSLGAMRDAADELDAIVEQAMRNRRERPWRSTPGE